MRGEDREADAFRGQHVERLVIHGRFRQPHAFGFSPEPTPEIGDTPAHLGHFVTPGGEGQDQVMVRHGDRTARAGGGDDRRVRSGRVALHPFEQRGPEIEAHRGERRGHGGVGFPLDALVPVVERRRVPLDGNGAGPRVVAGWLVEMPVDYDGPHQPPRASVT